MNDFGQVSTLLSPYGVFSTIVLLVIVFTTFASRGAGQLPSLPPVLALRRFRVNEAPADGNYVDISGRPTGLVSWLLGVFGIDDESRLTITATHLSLRKGSLYGQLHTIVPLTQVGKASCGYRKSVGFFAFGAYFIVNGVVGALLRGLAQEGVLVALLLSLLLGGILLLLYWLSTKMALGVSDVSSAHYVGLSFKASVIEGVAVDIEKVLQATAFINRKVLEAQLDPGTVALRIAQTAVPSARPRPRTAAPRATHCRSCGAELEGDSQFCGSCGAPVAAV